MAGVVKLSLADRLPLLDGRAMPVLGLGVWQASPAQTRTAVRDALNAGYRLLDTAKLYGNEAEVGEAVRASRVPREEIFVTTKLWNDDHGRDRSRSAFEASLRRLGLDYVDLYLIHWPGSDARVETWRTLIELAKDGRARSIGVSNFTVPHLEEIIAATSVVPVVNQVELHPFLRQDPVVEFCRAHAIRVEAYSPLARARRLNDPTLGAIARRCGRTPAQVMLRWSVQHGYIPIPKSIRPERIRENASIFDFELSAADMEAVDALGGSGRVAWDPSNVP